MTAGLLLGNFNVGSKLLWINRPLWMPMTDSIEDIVAPAAIERALMVYQELKPCDHSVLFNYSTHLPIRPAVASDGFPVRSMETLACSC
jgi:hypothetical protein